MKLWKENKLDQEYELSDEEILKRFKEWSIKQEKKRPGINEYRRIQVSLALFIGIKDGLNSTGNTDDTISFYQQNREQLQKIIYK